MPALDQSFHGSGPFTGGAPLRAWVLAARGMGDNHQLESLVRLLGAEVHWIPPPESTRAVVMDRLPGRRKRPIAAARRALMESEWPDLVLLAGGLGVVEACRIRAASGGRSRVVALGRPWAPLAWFDLVLTTPQYQLPKGPNVLVLPVPLNFPVCDSPGAETEADPGDGLPRPILGVILGGGSGSYRFTRADAERIAAGVDEEVSRAGGSAIVVASPRTPTDAFAALDAALQCPRRCFPWRPRADNPYPAVLRCADALLVTTDSASMLAEAAFTNRPLAVAHLTERPHARFFRALRRRTQWLSVVRRGLIRAGAWVPARDLRRVAERLDAEGRISLLKGILDRGAVDSGLERDLRDEVRSRVLALFEVATETGDSPS